MRLVQRIRAAEPPPCARPRPDRSHLRFPARNCYGVAACGACEGSCECTSICPMGRSGGGNGGASVKRSHEGRCEERAAPESRVSSACQRHYTGRAGFSGIDPGSSTNETHRCLERYQLEVTLILDFIHVLEYLWKAAWCFHAPSARKPSGGLEIGWCRSSKARRAMWPQACAEPRP
jgi:hypothetical protein